MAAPDRSIDPRILRSGKRHFLEKGYEGVSLKELCEDAKITTGALYKRYKGKEELFDALVADTVRDLYQVAEEKGRVDPKSLTDEELLRAWKMDDAAMMWWFDFLYQRYDGFMLLLCSSEGTRWSDFQHDWVETMTQYSDLYLKEAQRRGLASQSIDRAELHVLLTAFWTTIYEPFIHHFDRDRLIEHCQVICRLFNWADAMGFPTL